MSSLDFKNRKTPQYLDVDETGEQLPANAYSAHLARFTSIAGVKGVVLLDKAGAVLSGRLPPPFDASNPKGTAELVKALARVRSLAPGDSTQLLRFAKLSLVTKQLGERTVCLVVEQDTKLSVIRVALQVLALKLKQGVGGKSSINGATATSVTLSGSRAIPSDGTQETPAPPAPSDAIAAGVVDELRTLLGIHTKNSRAGSLVTRVLTSLNMVDSTVGRSSFGNVVDSLSRFVRDLEAKPVFVRECYEALVDGEVRARENTLKQLALFSEGVGLCTKLATPHTGVNEHRDEEEVVQRLGELMSQLGDLRLPPGTNTDFLSLGDLLLLSQEEQLHAGRLQQALVPRSELFEHGAANLAACYRPTMYCGGDWWQVRSLSGNRLMMVIADVTGHGTPAAILTGLLKGVWDQIPDTVTSPSTILGVLNASILNTYNREMMATCAVSIVDREAMEFHIASAGHNFPYLVRQGEGSHELQSLLARGNALGASMDSLYEATTVKLEVNDAIFWYTDGAVECMNPAGEQFGEKRLRRFLTKATVDRGPSIFRDEFLERLAKFCGNQALDDDLTVVVATMNSTDE